MEQNHNIEFDGGSASANKGQYQRLGKAYFLSPQQT